MFGITLHAQSVKQYIIKSGKAEQTVLHFGASDAWSMDKFGALSEEQKAQVADWLFSTENDAQGNPKGIGLSLWRFNLGAGSFEQGDSSQINLATRTECVMNSDGTFDWSKQKEQREFMKMAKKRGVPYILAFLNSVPVYYTANGMATNTGRGGTMNIKKDCYGKVAKFAAGALKGIEKQDGVHINYFSPVNEPDGSWNWLGPKQEGSPATNREIAQFTRAIDKEFSKNNLNTEITIMESSDYRALLTNHNTDWTRGRALDTFFSKDSADTYVGNLKNVPRLMLAHSYWTNTPLEYMPQIRKELRDSLAKRKIHFWQSEVCIMSNDTEIGTGKVFDYSMKTALYVARLMHNDLVFANAESWSWWRAVATYDYRDGMVRAYLGENGSWVADSKQLWAMGNFSRFVRPGAVRYDIEALEDGKVVPEGDTDQTGVMVSAYLNTDGKWAVVVINYSNDIRPFNLSMDNNKNMVWHGYRTSNLSTENLAPIGKMSGQTLLAPQSVTTFVSE